MKRHNLRDKFGRFTRKKREYKRKFAKVRPTPVSNKLIINAFVLDDSASMQGKEQATVGGFNEVLKSAQTSAAENNLKSEFHLCVFGARDNHKWYDQVKPLHVGYGGYRPNQGSTSLNDAIVYSINKLDQILATTIERDVQIVLTILTDGLDNDSRNTKAQVKELVDDKKARGWIINYLGAGTQEAAVHEAQTRGIFASNSRGYVNNSVGTMAAFTSVARATGKMSSNYAAGTVTMDGFFADEPENDSIGGNS